MLALTRIQVQSSVLPQLIAQQLIKMKVCRRLKLAYFAKFMPFADSGRPQRTHRLPWRSRFIQDVLPADFLKEPPPRPQRREEEELSLILVPQPVRPRVRLLVRFRTERNAFGLARAYESDPRPRNQPGMAADQQKIQSSAKSASPYGPYPNQSSWQLGSWFHSGSHKSLDDFRALREILLAPDFSLDEIRGVSWDRINADLARGVGTGLTDTSPLGNGWQSTTVKIQVPTSEKTSRHPSKEFEIPDVMHRSITSVMDFVRGKDTASLLFQDIPYKQTWQPHNPAWPKENVFSELSSSEPFAELHREVQKLQGEPGCSLERVADIFLLGSDSMALSSFGLASLWPVYLFWANQSKYDLANRASGACHVIAYLEKARAVILLDA